MIQTPICTSCNRTIPPGTKVTKFNCPNCGEITIWRCQKCRKFGRHYKCPKCGFMGP
ncbi:MAG: zinc finger domain-containing protein [Candidatus Bathyarchaeota archaeon]|nr:zinc finger domain-containing protein [Candidatus Bathyarchaeota archaeon]MDH5494892.1 zinc finger domain-containing protein [Candidatus Bathyarchaeota archaeon]